MVNCASVVRGYTNGLIGRVRITSEKHGEDGPDGEVDRMGILGVVGAVFVGVERAGVWGDTWRDDGIVHLARVGMAVGVWICDRGGSWDV
jgi:hypothetical protein